MIERRTNFVDPGPATVQVRRVEMEPWPDEAPQLPAVAHARQNVTGTPVEVAAGFSIAYAPFAISAALVASVVAAVAGAGAGVVAIVTLSVLSLTWLTGYVAQTIVSAAGADLLRVLLGYRLIRHEQRHRHEREGDR